MMVLDKAGEFFAVKCDYCGATPEDWYPDKDDAKNEAWTCGYIRLKDKDYCPDCWKGYCIGNKEPFYGIVVTADGKVWDEDTEEVIKPAR